MHTRNVKNVLSRCEHSLWAWLVEWLPWIHNHSLSISPLNTLISHHPPFFSDLNWYQEKESTHYTVFNRFHRVVDLLLCQMSRLTEKSEREKAMG